MTSSLSVPVPPGQRPRSDRIARDLGISGNTVAGNRQTASGKPLAQDFVLCRTEPSNEDTLLIV